MDRYETSDASNQINDDYVEDELNDDTRITTSSIYIVIIYRNIQHRLHTTCNHCYIEFVHAITLTNIIDVVTTRVYIEDTTSASHVQPRTWGTSKSYVSHATRVTTKTLARTSISYIIRYICCKTQISMTLGVINQNRHYSYSLPKVEVSFEVLSFVDSARHAPLGMCRGIVEWVCAKISSRLACPPKRTCVHMSIYPPPSRS